MEDSASGASRPLFERWASFAVRRRGLVLIAWVAIVAALLGAGSAFGGTFSDNFSVPGTEAQEAIDILEADFPAQSGGTSVIVVRADEGIQDPDVRASLEDLFAEVASLDGIAAVTSPYDNPALVGEDNIARAEVRWAGEPEDVSEGQLERYFEVVDAAAAEGLTIETGGQVVSANEMGEPNSEAIGLVAASIILVLAFGTVVAAGVPIAMALFGLGAGFGSMFLIANTGFLPGFAPPFAAMIGIGVGIDYSLLVVTRYREGLHARLNVHDAIVKAVSTSGRSVVFAGVVVAVSFLGLSAMGLPFVTALGVAGAIVVLFAVLVAISLLPAALAFIGHRIDRLRIPVLHSQEGISESSTWYRLSRAIQRRPLPWFVASTVVVLLIMSPILALNLGVTDEGNRAESFRSRRAYDLLAQGFGPGFNAPITVVVDGEGAIERAEAARDAAQAHPNIVQVSPPIPNESGDTVVFTAYPGTRPQSTETSDTIHDLRNDVFAGFQSPDSPSVLVTGAVAAFVDISDRISDRIAFLFIGVIGISFVLLTAVFRSVVVAAKAAVLNLMSIGAAFGVLVAVFQWGWFGSLIGVDSGPIETFAPMMLFAVLFGLSMDYEVFLISRIREEYVRTGDTSESVANGLAVTARVITAAAAIMCFVFFSFVLGDDRVIKLFGLGLGSAILVDATIIRLILVPSTMALLGRYNWWLPSWLDRLLPHINIEGSSDEDPVPAPSGSPAGGR
ncbi:MAG: MMPL family transporter [Dehalococcoidia bacterium]|nr:MMPL family transporter [Dehalococcoidia bacterium]